jgi:hypothetical protein
MKKTFFFLFSLSGPLLYPKMLLSLGLRHAASFIHPLTSSRALFGRLFSLFSLFSFLFVVAVLPAQQDDEFERGDPAMAEKYLLWAQDAIAAGNWAEARSSL